MILFNRKNKCNPHYKIKTLPWNIAYFNIGKNLNP